MYIYIYIYDRSLRVNLFITKLSTEDVGFSASALIFTNTQKSTEYNIISVINPVITSFTTRFEVFF
jgi:hypothetical protein